MKTLELDNIDDLKDLKVKAGWKFWAAMVAIGVAGYGWYDHNEKRMKALEDGQSQKVVNAATKADIDQAKSDMRAEWKAEFRKVRKINCDRFVIRGADVVPCYPIYND